MLHIYTMFDDLILHSPWETYDKNLPWKERNKWTNKGKNNSNEPDSQSYHKTNKLSICISNLKILVLIRPEKTETQTF